MFERCFLEQPGDTTSRPWAVLASFAGQIAAVGFAVLLPLVFTDSLPKARFLSIFVAPGAPPARPKQAPAPKVKPARIAARTWSGHGLLAPQVIPQRAAMIIEEPVAAVTGNSGDVAGVFGAIGEPSLASQAAFRRLVSGLPESAGSPPNAAPKPAEPAPPARLKVGGVVQMAKAVSRPLPKYPALALQARISGIVRVEAVIGADGVVRNLRVTSGHPLLIPAAVEAVRQWRFQPTLLNGVPVEVETQLDVVFTLNQ